MGMEMPEKKGTELDADVKAQAMAKLGELEDLLEGSGVSLQDFVSEHAAEAEDDDAPGEEDGDEASAESDESDEMGAPAKSGMGLGDDEDSGKTAKKALIIAMLKKKK